MVWTTQDRVKNSASTMLSPYSRKAFTGRCLPFRLLEPTRGRQQQETLRRIGAARGKGWRGRRLDRNRWHRVHAGKGQRTPPGRPAGAPEEGQLAGETTPVGDLPFGQ